METELNNTKNQNMKLLNNELIKSYLTISGLYLTGYELLKGSIIERLKGCFCLELIETEDGELKFIETEEYKKIKNQSHLELKNKKDELYSFIKWHQEANIISSEEFKSFLLLRDQRNVIAHNLPRLIIDDKFNLDMELFNNLKKLLIKIEMAWMMQFEIPSNPAYDGMIIKEEDVSTGPISLIEYLFELVKEELEKSSTYR